MSQHMALASSIWVEFGSSNHPSVWAQVQLARVPGPGLYYPTKRPKETENSLYTHIKKILKTLIARINMVVNEDALISQAPIGNTG